MTLLQNQSESKMDTKKNKNNLKYVKENHHLGPEKTSIYPNVNVKFWSELAIIWDVPLEDARRRFCANCEYYDNTPKLMKDMERIPLDNLDADGGGRGYCHKFDFICHNLRTCDAWEEKEFIMPEDINEDGEE